MHLAPEADEIQLSNIRPTARRQLHDDIGERVADRHGRPVERHRPRCDDVEKAT
jgi:hypothetical protein